MQNNTQKCKNKIGENVKNKLVKKSKLGNLTVRDVKKQSKNKQGIKVNAISRKLKKTSF